MTQKTPPAALPSEYRGIWQALSAADGCAASRQVLARQLGLSTHTIQRILVSGDVPQFPETSNTRILRSWVRIITRLAYHSGEDPRHWIEMVGIRWSAEARAASEAALRRAALRGAALPDEASAPPTSTADLAPTVTAAAIPPSAAAAATAPVRPGAPSRLWAPAKLGVPEKPRVGISSRAPFAANLPAFGRSFLEEYARRIVTALSPNSRPEFHALSEREVVSRLAGPSPSLDLGAGIAETVEREAAGLEFVGSPGWSIQLSGGVLRKRGDKKPVPRWLEVTSPQGASLPDTEFVVASDGLSEHFLRTQCGVRSERLVAVDTPDVRTGETGDVEDVHAVKDAAEAAAHEVARVLIAETERWPERLVVLVGDQTMLALVGNRIKQVGQAELIERAEEVGQAERAGHVGKQAGSIAAAYTFEPLPGEKNEYPSYHIGIALGPELAGEYGYLLARATQEVFTSAPAQIASLYAAFMAHSVLNRETVDLLDPLGTGLRGLPSLRPFAEASAEFRHLLTGCLQQSLTAALEAKLASPGLLPTCDAEARAADIARRLTGAYLRLMLPEEWSAEIEAATEALSSAFCRSCAASLHDQHNRGVSDRYCRFCSDEQGHLRPRPEVEKILAKWFEYWQGNLASDEAMRRAKIYMQAMPAWCTN